MSGPWEKYAKAESAPSAGKPWEKYSTQGSEPRDSDMSWGDVATGAVENFIPSLGNTLGAAVSPFIHPVDTAKALYHTGQGLMEKMANEPSRFGHEYIDPSIQPVTGEHEKYANAVGQYFANRYGSVEGFKKALATDPAGVMMDVASVAAPEASLAKAPGLVGKVGKVASKVAEVTDPLRLTAKTVGKLAKPAGNVAAEVLGNVTTRAGALPIKLAFQSGLEGGKASMAFLNNMRGKAPLEETVDSARAAVKAMRMAKNRAYKAGMYDVAKDKSILDWGPIDKAVMDAEDIKRFKGEDFSPKTVAIREEMKNALDRWRKLDPAEYHTPEGMDALKQNLWEIMASTAPHTPEYEMAKKIYHGVRDEIANQAPGYAKVMKDYQEAMQNLSEVEKTLSLGEGKPVDTALRKLQSIMRDNVNTSFGYRKKLGEMLKAHGATEIEPALAGQALSAGTPRGLGVYGALAEMTALPALMHDWRVTLGLPLFVPRAVGEGAHALGAAGRRGAPAANVISAAERFAPATYQVGKVPDITQQLANPY